MLVLSRKKNESVVINNNISVTVVEIRGDKVRLGIVAPKECPVHRQEVYDAIYGYPPPPPPPRLQPAEEIAFLRALEQDPDDETTRLIFADWLEERGDPLAELIRIQAELGKLLDDDERRWHLELRRSILWSEHGRSWSAFL